MRIGWGQPRRVRKGGAGSCGKGARVLGCEENGGGVRDGPQEHLGSTVNTHWCRRSATRQDGLACPATATAKKG